ncbi:polysaccharide deacetylase family protein [Paenibacillus dokdonensis]|uniref:polysaccharide deacetylase family protein n=1 Tax=Paenibacillus dokdonensis TaxID=2567944 RepID=UPI0010A8151C|nr:polysaccharide deacetylase family protein [Paenibacillus dokdonensis]
MLSNTVINRIETEEKAVAFTFDDGPNAEYTPQILDIFRESDAKATFYMIGTQMQHNPALVRTVYQEGHEIGNHTFSHPHLTELSEQDYMHEVVKTENLLSDIIGIKPATFRPPYFDHNEQVDGLVSGLGYPMIGVVNSEANDWDLPGVQHILDKTRAQVKPGSILLFHDGFGDRSQTVEAVRILVSELVADGYKLVTVSELLKLAAV